MMVVSGEIMMLDCLAGVLHKLGVPTDVMVVNPGQFMSCQDLVLLHGYTGLSGDGLGGIS